jgi:dTDP-4-amino-4,6-dideoxygalactose transaminase
MYEELLADVPGIHVHSQPATGEYDSNYWLCTITVDPEVKVKGQENAYKTIVTGAVGGAAGVIHAASSATTDCQPNDNVEALRVALDQAQIEARPVWKPMHKQPVYSSAPAYINGVSEEIFRLGMCLPAGPCVSDEEVRYIVQSIKDAIVY